MSSDAGSSDSSTTSPVVDPSRPVEKIDEGLLQFTHQEDGEQRPHCLASGWIVQGGQKKPEYHLTHSTETKKLIGKCSRLLNQLVCNINDTEISYGDCCGIMERGFESSGSSPAVPNESKNASSEKLPPKRRRVNDGSEGSQPLRSKPTSSGVSKKRKRNNDVSQGSLNASASIACAQGDAMSLQQLPVQEDNALLIIGRMVKINLEIIGQTKNLHRATYKLIFAALPNLTVLQFLSGDDPFDSESALVHVSELEEKILKIFSAHSNDLPFEVRKNLSEFIDLTFKFRRVCEQVSLPGLARERLIPLREFCFSMMKIHISMSWLIHDFCGSEKHFDANKKAISEIYREYTTAIMKLVGACNEPEVSTSSAVELIEAASNARKRIATFRDILPAEVKLKVLDMFEVISNFLKEEVMRAGVCSQQSSYVVSLT